MIILCVSAARTKATALARTSVRDRFFRRRFKHTIIIIVSGETFFTKKKLLLL